MIPKGKGKKYATTCFRSDPRRKAVGKNSFILRHCQGEHGWCGTIPLNGDSNTVARPTVDSGWGYCTDDCKGDRKKTELTKPMQSGVGVWSTDYLQITNIDVLQGADCLTMCKKSTLVPHPQVLVRGINSTKVMDLDKQVV